MVKKDSRLVSRKKPLIASNGPFELMPVSSSRRWGYIDQATTAPLAVDVLGTDGKAPHAKNGEAVSMRVRFSVLEVPEGAASNLLSGTLEAKLTSVDENGRAFASLQLGTVKGVYTVSAVLVKSPQSAVAYFDAYTQGVAFDIDAEPIHMATVDRLLKLRLEVRDWRGQAVNDAALAAGVLDTDSDFNAEGPDDARAGSGRGGKYSISLRHEVAGMHEIDIGDAVSGASTLLSVEFLPGKVRDVTIVEQEIRRRFEPDRRVRLSAFATDKFGNLVRGLPSQWTGSKGKVRAVHPDPLESAAGIVELTADGKAIVSTRIGTKRSRHLVQRPDIGLVATDLAPITYSGNHFRLALVARAPAGGGVLEGYRLRIHEPSGMAERISFRATNADFGFAEPEICELGDGVIELSLDGLNIPLSKEGMDLSFGEFDYLCLCPEEACFELSDATLTIARSPGEEYELNPGANMCQTQKEEVTKTLCLKICIAAKPKAGKTPQQVFDAIKQDVEADVAAAQQVFTDNVPTCCPIITIAATYDEIPWAEYNAIVNSGGKRGAMEVLPRPWEDVEADKDEAKDVFEPHGKLKDLLKKCRSDDCVVVYYVPTMKLKKNGRWKKLNGATISTGDFPETTDAEGSGAGIVLHQGLPASKNSLIHELGHLLIDLPRDNNCGVEHVGNGRPVRDRVMKTTPPHGDEFSKEECSRIFDNIGSYGGS